MKVKKKKRLKLKASVVNEAVDFLKTLGTSVIIVTIMVNFFIRPIRVDGSSMYPTLESDSFGIANVLGVKMGHLERFDIVVIYLSSENKYLVKRIVGLPGEEISYQNGTLYVNGEEVREEFFDREYISSWGDTFMADVKTVTLGENEYFCLGDNRPNSKDSRYYGPFKKDQIRCKGALILYPFSRFGLHSW